MIRIIEELKQQREKAKQKYIELSIANRERTTVFETDTESYLDKIIELNDVIIVLENHSMPDARQE